MPWEEAARVQIPILPYETWPTIEALSWVHFRILSVEYGSWQRLAIKMRAYLPNAQAGLEQASNTQECVLLLFLLRSPRKVGDSHVALGEQEETQDAPHSLTGRGSSQTAGGRSQ